MHDWLNKTHDAGIVLAGRDVAWDRQALRQHIDRARSALLARTSPAAPVAILADNSPEWIAIDLATQELGITLVPLPSFFTPAQWMHAIRAAGVQAIFCPQAAHAQGLDFTGKLAFEGELLLHEAAGEPAYVSLADVQKITFTSGTTSEPKGVCLSTRQQWQVAGALRDMLAPLNIKRHLNLLPLSVLLENIAGVYTALLSGATNICPPLAEAGLSGASGFDPRLCMEAIGRYRAESVILLPQMLQALVALAVPHDKRLRSLKYVAVGGAKTPTALIHAARDKGLPVHEGYGLSECGSVVALNVPGADCLGSVGRPIPGRAVRIAGDGEIEVGGAGIARYLGAPPETAEWLPTGDIGHLDEDGFLYISGRKKNVLITAYGRNVSPEWPEAALLGTGVFAQALVFGDGRPWLSAVLVPASPAIDMAAMQAAVDKANAELPDYARVRRWFAAGPFMPDNGLATPNGRPRREAILQRYREQCESLYDFGE